MAITDKIISIEENKCNVCRPIERFRKSRVIDSNFVPLSRGSLMPRADARAGELVFATVGTTQFDGLVQALLAPEALSLLASQGYRCLIIQVQNPCA